MTDIVSINKEQQLAEIDPKAKNGMLALILNIFLMLASCFVLIYQLTLIGTPFGFATRLTLIIVSALYLCLIGPILFAGLKILKPNEALVLTLFGKYYGTLKGQGFFFVNPFVSAFNPAASAGIFAGISMEQGTTGTSKTTPSINIRKESRIMSIPLEMYRGTYNHPFQPKKKIKNISLF